MFEPIFVTAFPVILLIELAVRSAALRRQKIDMEGAPPINRPLFLLSKLVMLAPWSAMVLQSFGVKISWTVVPAPLKWISLVLWAAGFFLAIAGPFALGSSFRVGCAKEETALRTGGLYHFSRNPIYVGLNATFLAATLYTLNPFVLLIGAGLAGVHHRIILAEEECLRRSFGKAYEDYCLKVGRYL